MICRKFLLPASIGAVLPLCSGCVVSKINVDVELSIGQGARVALAVPAVESNALASGVGFVFECFVRIKAILAGVHYIILIVFVILVSWAVDRVRRTCRTMEW